MKKMLLMLACLSTCFVVFQSSHVSAQPPPPVPLSITSLTYDSTVPKVTGVGTADYALVPAGLEYQWYRSWTSPPAWSAVYPLAINPDDTFTVTDVGHTMSTGDVIILKVWEKGHQSTTSTTKTYTH